MPRGDRTGPNNEGPMSGRGMGYCTGSNSTGFENNQGFGCRRGFGGGQGRGRGRGMGQRFCTNPQNYKEVSKEEILEKLKENKARIEKAIKEIEQKESKE